MISVIIPVKNGAASIHQCLQAALAQEGLEQPYEVLVVDDGSTDNTRQLAEQMGVQVITQPNAGPAAARNTGAAAARGELLVYTDADCEPSPDWLRQISDPFINPEIIAAKGAYRTRQQSLVARFVQQEYESKYARMRGMASIDFVDTYSAAYRREIFLQNGGFDPAFPIPSVEDQEAFRLARKGYRMIFIPQATVFHKHDESAVEYYVRKYAIGNWKAFMLRWVPEKALSDSHTLSSQRCGVALTSNPKREAANKLYQSMGFQKRETNAYFYKLD